MAGCMMCTTAAPQSTMIHSPFSSPSERGLGKPSFLNSSRTLAAKALVCRLELPEAMITRSKRGDMASVLNTRMSTALMSSKAFTMVFCNFWMLRLACASERSDSYSLMSIPVEVMILDVLPNIRVKALWMDIGGVP